MRTPTLTLFLATSLLALNLLAADKKNETEPRIIDPGPPPSDALVLFSGKDLSQWKNEKGGEAKWKVEEGVATVNGTGSIITKEEFGDVQLHVEWATPSEVKGEGQGRGNSGVYLQGRYELQVLDSYKNSTYVNGQAGSIYKQGIPLVNPSRKPGEWQIYDVVWTAPIFNADSSLKSPAYVTVFFNNVLVQNHFELKGETRYIGQPSYHKYDTAPILLQAHGDPSEPISFRNIWVRELK